MRTPWVIVAALASIASVVAPAATAPLAEAAEETRGITRATVAVGGIASGDPTTSGADIGARARFERENERGGVAGRTIVYTGIEVDHASKAENAAAIAKLAASALAIVPASTPVLDFAQLDRVRMPFFGPASSPAWASSTLGFGFAGAEAVEQPRTASPAWGLLLDQLLGSAKGKGVVIAADSSALGSARAVQAAASVRAAGFRVVDTVTVPAPTDLFAPAPDLTTYATRIVAAKPDVALVLTTVPYTIGLSRRLGELGFEGTVGADNLYDPARPEIANGVTVLTTTAPIEQDTPANRRMVADVRALKADQTITPGVAAGYWSADLFVALLRKVGRQLTVSRLLEVANRDNFRHDVPGAVGPTSWPAMHRRGVPCGALVQSDGTRFLLAEPYQCGTSISLTRSTRGKGG